MRTIAVLCVLFWTAQAALDPRECEDYAKGVVVNLKLTRCRRYPCILRKGTNVTLEFDFEIDYDVANITNNVHALLGTVKAPFQGVHGTPACPFLFPKDSETPVQNCFLTPGFYTYRNSFSVRKEYPAISVKVEWALKEEDDFTTCFVLPARIVNK